MIANVQSSLRTAAWFASEDAAAVVGAVKRQVHASSLADRYATLFYGVFDEDARALRYVNAGHNSPIIVRGRRLLHRLEAGGPPVGLFSEVPYEPGMVQLEPGDIIVAYTDGVVEAADAAGKRVGSGWPFCCRNSPSHARP
jgi:sigma-B regulation protein RsbU (phosphoserine phosphatase)